MENNLYQNKIQDQRITVTEKHIATINAEMGNVKVNVATIMVTQKLIAGVLFLILSGLIGLWIK